MVDACRPMNGPRLITCEIAEASSKQMIAVTAPVPSIAPSPSKSSLSGLDGVNFLAAGMAAGFGPYVAAYLADQKWTQQDIGFVLTAGGLAGLISQLPGGELVDIARPKRMLVALGGIIVAASGIIMYIQPTLSAVFSGLVLQGVTGGFHGPAIASISLGLVGHARLSERLGRNQRFASFGGLTAAVLMGLVAYFLSYRAIFAIVAILALPMLAMLGRIRPTEIHFGRSCGAPEHYSISRPARVPHQALWTNSTLLTFAAGLFLFQLANASMLPLIGEALAYQWESRSSLILSALIILPQIIVAIMATWVGRQAQVRGRRPLLLIGFVALPIRSLLFALTTNPGLLVGIQLLDAVSGAVVGVLTALVIADITNGTGRFNLAQGFVGTASGVGASLSTTLFGFVAAHFDRSAAFLGIALVGLVAALLFWFWMPETKPRLQNDQMIDRSP